MTDPGAAPPSFPELVPRIVDFTSGPDLDIVSAAAELPPATSIEDAVRDGRFGEMVALQAGDIVLLPLAAALQEPKLLDPKLLELASVFFG